MDHLPDLVQPLLKLIFGSFQSGLAQVNRICQQRTPRVDALGVAAFRKLDSF